MGVCPFPMNGTWLPARLMVGFRQPRVVRDYQLNGWRVCQTTQQMLQKNAGLVCGRATAIRSYANLWRMLTALCTEETKRKTIQYQQ